MIKIIEPDWPAPKKVKAYSTTRHGGNSVGVFASLNLGAHVSDSVKEVDSNRALIQWHLNMPAAPTWLNQVHGSNILDLSSLSTRPTQSASVTSSTAINEQLTADAAYSRVKNEICTIMTADCLPILITDIQGNQVAAIHAGWRSLGIGIVEETRKTFSCSDNELIAWLGPAISEKHFEVGEDVYNLYLADSPESGKAFKLSDTHSDKWMADIYELARIRLNRCGIKKVFGGEHCTYENNEDFFSYRRDNTTGRMATFIWIEE